MEPDSPVELETTKWMPALTDYHKATLLLRAYIQHKLSSVIANEELKQAAFAAAALSVM